jgi:hypothetical protein
MTKLLSKNILSPILFGLAVWMASTAPTRANPANPEIPSVTPEAGNSLVINDDKISQTREAVDIKPGDWAYQTLQALSTKYGCSNTPSGDKILSR